MDKIEKFSKSLPIVYLEDVDEIYMDSAMKFLESYCMRFYFDSVILPDLKLDHKFDLVEFKEWLFRNGRVPKQKINYSHREKMLVGFSMALVNEEDYFYYMISCLKDTMDFLHQEDDTSIYDDFIPAVRRLNDLCLDDNRKIVKVSRATD